MRETGDLAREILEALIRGETPPKMDLQDALDDLGHMRNGLTERVEELEDNLSEMESDKYTMEMDRDEYMERCDDLDTELEAARERIYQMEVLLDLWSNAFDAWDCAGSDIETREREYNQLVSAFNQTKDLDL